MEYSNSPEPTSQEWMHEIRCAIEELAAAQRRIQLIQQVGDHTSQLEQWATLILTQLKEVRSSSDRISRRIVIDMVRTGVLTQRQAALNCWI